MILRINKIPASQLKIPFDRFIESYVEQIASSVFDKSWQNRTKYSKSERPFIGYKRNDGSFYIETQYVSYLKTTGMFYFIISLENNELKIVSGIRQKLWLVSTTFGFVLLSIIMFFNLMFNPDPLQNTIIIGVILLLVFAFGRPLWEWTSARLKLYKKLIKQF